MPNRKCRAGIKILENKSFYEYQFQDQIKLNQIKSNQNKSNQTVRDVLHQHANLEVSLLNQE